MDARWGGVDGTLLDWNQCGTFSRNRANIGKDVTTGDKQELNDFRGFQ
jgi:hypothetical protein